MPVPAPIELGTGHIALETRLIHAESGQWISSVTIIPLPKNDPQGMGSAITYARRYSLCAMLGIITEDDDGNAASIPEQHNTHQPRQNSNQSYTRQEQQPKPRFHPPQARQEQPAPVSNGKEKAEYPGLPTIPDVQYEESKDADGRNIVIARGATLPNKDALKRVGFRWSPERKAWWIAA